jgi:hypothetical protein
MEFRECPVRRLVRNTVLLLSLSIFAHPTTSWSADDGDPRTLSEIRKEVSQILRDRADDRRETRFCASESSSSKVRTGG